MDDVANRLAKELAAAIAAAVEKDPGVEACHRRAREQGYRMDVALEAVIGFAQAVPNRKAERSTALVKQGGERSDRKWKPNANDKRFLRTLRISSDEAEKTSEVE